GSGGDTTTGIRGDGDAEGGDVVSAEACEGAEAGSGGAGAEGGDVVSAEACEGAGVGVEGADAGAGDVVSAEACTEDCDGFVATVVKADAGLSERLPSSLGADGDIAGLPCPLLSDGEDCGEDWAWVAK